MTNWETATLRHWTSYFYSGSIALIASWVLAILVTGCRVGNYESPAPTSSVRFLSTQPYSFTVHSTQTSNGNSSDQQVQPSFDDIPGLVADHFTNPTEFVTIDSKTGKSAILAPGASYYFQVFADASNVITSSENSGLSYFWPDQNGDAVTTCQMSSAYSLSGNIVSTPASSADTMIGKVNVNGSLQFQFSYLINFQGSDCGTVLQSMSDCYQNLGNCPGTTSAAQVHWQNLLRNGRDGLYDLYIRTSAMQASDIPTTTSLGYEVSYQ